MATEFHRHLPGAGCPQLGRRCTAAHAATVLDHACTLARSDLERLGIRSRIRRRPHDGAPLSRLAVLPLRRAAASPLVREHRQAAGAIPESVRFRPRHPAHAARRGLARRPPFASEGRRIVGRLHRVPGDRAARGGARAVLPLVNAQRGGLGPARRGGPCRYGFEVKRAEAPRLTPSMRSSVETLGLTRLDVVHAGNGQYALADGVRALPSTAVKTELTPL